MSIEIVRTVAGVVPLHGCVLVPTMGYLHAGHRALIERAVAAARSGERRRPVVVSLFVNPTQFNDATDYSTYPRDEARDVEFCAQAGADAVFSPSVEQMYPEGTDVPAEMDLPEVATRPGLEDAFRPGHFAGVCRVCRRLFEVTGASAAVFGEKDWQQLVVVRTMVRMLGMNVEIVPHRTVREEDGLAMSSRNVRLAPTQRKRAAALHRALEEANRHSDPDEAEHTGRRVCLAASIRPEYFVVRDAETFLEYQRGRPGRVLVAAQIGAARLIDNAAWGQGALSPVTATQ